jgi:hypothetical protein
VHPHRAIADRAARKKLLVILLQSPCLSTLEGVQANYYCAIGVRKERFLSCRVYYHIGVSGAISLILDGTEVTRQRKWSPEAARRPARRDENAEVFIAVTSGV